ncbi:MAG TPA: tRNA-intron lyase [Methanomicrobia archaeon]|nr:tRNA-intron lyase [Methanomicrobia archaeon]
MQKPYNCILARNIMIGELLNDEVLVTDSRSVSALHSKRSYGVVKEGTLHLSAIEAAYLHERGKLEIKSDDTTLSREDLWRRLAGPDFSTRYTVYKDLRDKGYIVKTGFKYGCHFRVYRTSVEEHADYLVHAYKAPENISAEALVRYVRLAHSVKKQMIIALVDEESDINYYELARKRL